MLAIASCDLRTFAEKRAAENGIISARFAKFQKIISFKGKTLESGVREDFESEAFNRFYRSVRLHLAQWENGTNNGLLTVIANGALNWALARKRNRDKIIENLKNCV